MKKCGFLLLIILSFSSCASLLNKKYTTVKISADKASKVIFKADTISINKERTTIRPERSNKPLKITLIKDSLQQDFLFKKKISATAFLNFYNYGIGFIVDIITKRGFRYNNNLHFITDSISNKIILSNKKVTVIPKNKIFIYTSPLQAFDLFSTPMATIGVEYFIKDNFSLSAEYGNKIISNFRRRNDVIILNEKAINYRLETKLYNKINFTKNVHLNEYLALEFREIKSQYNDKIEYGFQNDANRINSIVDDFATKKRVTIINLKYGLLLPIRNRFYFDFYGGFGIRIKKFQDFEYDFDSTIHKIYDEDDIFSFGISDIQDSYENPLLNITAGFKFGFKL